MGAMMVSDNSDDDLLTFEEESGADHADGQPVWRILIIDDEPSVHQATMLALKGITLEGRVLEFLHAYSASEARTVLADNPDLAVVLLDVVMESHDAGLQLIRFVREELGNKALRVILRTGQPGYAPEIDTIRTYDINDYKTKSELTRIRLFTSLTVAIRSYWQIHCLEANRRGLELIVAASTELSRPRGLVRFDEGVVTQLCALLGVREEGIVCAAGGTINAEPFILAAAGCYSEWIGQTLQGHWIQKLLLAQIVDRFLDIGPGRVLGQDRAKGDLERRPARPPAARPQPVQHGFIVPRQQGVTLHGRKTSSAHSPEREISGLTKPWAA